MIINAFRASPCHILGTQKLSERCPHEASTPRRSCQSTTRPPLICTKLLPRQPLWSAILSALTTPPTQACVTMPRKAAQHEEPEEQQQQQGHESAKGGTGSERSFLAAAHNETNSKEARLHAATEYCKLHNERTGEKLDPHAVIEHTGKASHHKRS